MNYVANNNSENNNYYKLAGRGFGDMSKFSASSISIWKDIFESNKDNIVKHLDGFVKELENVKESIINNDMEKIFERANINRDKFEKYKGI